MKNFYKYFFVSVLFSAFLCTSIIFAQDEQEQEEQSQKPKYFLIQSEKPFPDKVSDYEATQKKVGAFIKKYNFDINWNAFSTDDHTYYYVSEINNLGDIDRMNEEFEKKSTEESKKDFQNINDSFNGIVDSYNTEVFMLSPNSYSPKEPITKPEYQKYYKQSIYFIKPYSEAKLTAALKDIKDFCEQNNIGLGYEIYANVLGNSNEIVFMEGAKSPEDYKQIMDELNSKYGDQFKPVWDKFMSLVKDTKSLDCWYRHDLSTTKD